MLKTTIFQSKNQLIFGKMFIPVIRGFKGNRILYGDSLDAVGEVTEEDTDDDNDGDNYDDGEEEDVMEPVYSEPQFALADESQVSSSDVSSGYLSHVSHVSHVSQHHNLGIIKGTSAAGHSLSSPESGYLSSSDEDCLVVLQGEHTHVI